MPEETVMDSLPRFTQRFATVETCLRHLEAVRWADGAYCPHCGGSERIYHYRDGQRHKCGECNRVFRIITGTIFADSPIKLLPKWFAAIWLDTCHDKGISSVRLAKDIGVTQKTAWRMLRRIRQAFDTGDDGMLGGTAEVHATRHGVKEWNKRASQRTNCLRAPDIDHDRGGYAWGQDGTNVIEGLRAMVKQACAGVHHHWSWRHTRRCLGGCAFRGNGVMLPCRGLVA